MLHVDHPVLAHLPALAKGHQALVDEAADQGVTQQQQQGPAKKDSHVVMFLPYHQRLCLSQTASPVASASGNHRRPRRRSGSRPPACPQVDAEQAGQEAGGQEQQRHHRHLVGAAVGRLRHQVVDLVRQHGGARHPASRSSSQRRRRSAMSSRRRLSSSSSQLIFSLARRATRSRWGEVAADHDELLADPCQPAIGGRSRISTISSRSRI